MSSKKNKYLKQSNCFIISKQVQKSFHYTRVLPPANPFPEINSNVIQPALKQFLNGYNASVVTLGTTGSGKSYVLEQSMIHFVESFFARLEKNEDEIVSRKSGTMLNFQGILKNTGFNYYMEIIYYFL